MRNSRGMFFHFKGILVPGTMHRPNKYSQGFELTVYENVLNEPTKWKKQSNISVYSMSDLFHKDVPFAFFNRVIDTGSIVRRHTTLHDSSVRCYDFNYREKLVRWSDGADGRLNGAMRTRAETLCDLRVSD